MNIIQTGKGLRTAVLWLSDCVAIALLGLGRALGRSCRGRRPLRAPGQCGRCMARGSRARHSRSETTNFSACAHVIKDFSDHGADEVFINQYGTKNSRTLRVSGLAVCLSTFSVA